MGHRNRNSSGNWWVELELCRLPQQRNPGTCWRHRCSRCLCHNPGQELWTFSGVEHRSSHPKPGPPSPLCGRYRDGLAPPRHMEAGRFLCGIHGNFGRSLYGRGTFRGSCNKVSNQSPGITMDESNLRTIRNYHRRRSGLLRCVGRYRSLRRNRAVAGKAEVPARVIVDRVSIHQSVQVHGCGCLP